MDYVLGISDSLFFDKLYATFLPLLAPSLESFKGNATAFAGAARINAPIENDIASEYFGLNPSEDAYLSQWQRSDWQRQTLSLFALTWYLRPFPTTMAAVWPANQTSINTGFSAF